MATKRQDLLLRTAGMGLTGILLAMSCLGPRGWAESGRRNQTPDAQKTLNALYAPDELAALDRRFQTEVWPLLSRNCTGCHTASNPSQLHFMGGAEDSFKTLIADGHLDPSSPASILARVTTPDPSTHMPPKPAPTWSEAEIGTLRRYCNDLYAKRAQGGPKMEEMFPPALLTPYRGRSVVGSGDNTFLTYYQLRKQDQDAV